MKSFTLDDGVVQSKAGTATDKIGTVIWNLGQGDSVILDAVNEVNKHNELAGIAYGSIASDLQKLNEVIDKYARFQS